MTTIPEEANETRLERLQEYICSLEVGREVALHSLKDRNDLDSLRRRARLLLGLKKPEEVLDLLRDSPLDRQLHEQLLRARFRTERLREGVEHLREICKRGPFISSLRACVIAHFELFEVVKRLNADFDPASFNSLSSSELDSIRILEQSCTSLLDEIRLKGTAATAAEKILCSSVLSMRIGLGLTSENVIPLLSRVIPFPIELANLAFSHLVKAESHWVDAIRRDYPDDDDAQVIADLMDGIIFKNAERAFAALVARCEKPFRGLDKQNIFAGLHELSRELGKAERDRTRELAPALLADHPQLNALFEAEMALMQGAPATAEKLLTEWQNASDPTWVQLYAHLARSKGEHAQAIELLRAFTKRHSHTALLELLADIALESENYDVAREALIPLIREKPDSASLQRNLAQTYLRQNDKFSAIPFILRATQLRPEDGVLLATYAQCLADVGRSQESLDALRQFLQANPHSLHVRLTLAEVLNSDAKPQEAFEVLSQASGSHSEEPAFLVAMMETAHRSNHDRQAHDALTKLIRLQEAGTISKDVMRTASLDELIALGKENRERLESANRESLFGRMPWLSIATLERSPAYWAWHLRTQPLRWYGESPENVAAYSVYCSNSFTTVQGEGGRADLVQIAAPSAGAAVTLDLSALLTIFHLNLFEEAESYFSRIFVPAIYLEVARKEKQRLLPHQLSQRTSVELIEKAVARGKLLPIDSTGAFTAKLCEYEETAGVFRLRNLHASLSAAGLLTRPQSEQLMSVSHKDDNSDSLPLRIELVTDLSTLQTLVRCEVLDLVTDNWALRIPKSDWEEAQQTLRAYDAQNEIYDAHQRMWDKIRTSPTVTLVPLTNKVPILGESEVAPTVFATGVFVAEATKTPLFVDDRALQQIVLNQTKVSPIAAFGSDAWLCELLSYGTDRRDDLAAKYLSMLERRYKFLLPSVEMLLAIAGLYSSTVPNRGLQSIARYVHACMRDPGLYSGNEPVVPPTSIALRLYLSWISQLSRLLARVWSSNTYSESFARALTAWVVDDCLPSSPQQVGTLVGANVAWEARNAALGHFCGAILGYQVDDEDRLGIGFGVVRQALGFNDEAYVRKIADLMESITDFEDLGIEGHAEAKRAIMNRMAVRALRHQESWPIFVDTLLSHGHLASSIARDAPREFKDAVSTADLGPNRRPFHSALLLFGKPGGVQSVEELWVGLYLSDADVRVRVAKMLIQLVDSVSISRTDFTGKLTALRDTDEARWRAAASFFHTLIATDFRIACLTAAEAAKYGIAELSNAHHQAAFGLSVPLMRAIRQLAPAADSLRDSSPTAFRVVSAMQALNWSTRPTPEGELGSQASFVQLIAEERISSEGWTALAALASGMTDEPEGIGLRFRVFKRLAHHYLKVVECAQPGLSQESVVDVALTLANFAEWSWTVRGFVGEAPPDFSPEMRAFELYWQYMRSPSISTSSYSQTIRGLSPFCPAIAQAIEKGLERVTSEPPTDQQRDAIEAFLKTCLVASTGDSDTAEYGFRLFESICRKWLASFPSEKLQQICDAAQVFRETELVPQTLLAAYRDLADLEGAAQEVTLRLVDESVRQQTIKIEDVLAVWNDTNWRHNLVVKAKDTVFDQMMTDCFSWFPLQSDSAALRWIHALVDTLLSLDEGSEHFDRLVPYILASAARTNTISAVDRIVASCENTMRMESIRKAGAFLRSNSLHSPSWLSGRLRSVCVSLQI